MICQPRRSPDGGRFVGRIDDLLIRERGGNFRECWGMRSHPGNLLASGNKIN
jgi:hypothetical protein